jgi:uncharacterized protein YjbJ (UPF0337 family)
VAIFAGMSLSGQKFSRPALKMGSGIGIVDREQIMMKPSTKDTAKGNLHDLKGTIKEKAGKLLNDPDLEAEGQAEKIGGKIQKKVGQVEKVLGK